MLFRFILLVALAGLSCKEVVDETCTEQVVTVSWLYESESDVGFRIYLNVNEQFAGLDEPVQEIPPNNPLTLSTEISIDPCQANYVFVRAVDDYGNESSVIGTCYGQKCSNKVTSGKKKSDNNGPKKPDIVLK